ATVRVWPREGGSAVPRGCHHPRGTPAPLLQHTKPIRGACFTEQGHRARRVRVGGPSFTREAPTDLRGDETKPIAGRARGAEQSQTGGPAGADAPPDPGVRAPPGGPGARDRG